MNKVKLFFTTIVITIILCSTALCVNNKVILRYCLNDNATVSIYIYNVSLGQSIKTLIQNQPQSQGSHEVEWDGSSNNGDVGTGNYVYRIYAVINGSTYLKEEQLHYIK
jgi:flagellar hook assembly protein FlgD